MGQKVIVKTIRKKDPSKRTGRVMMLIDKSSIGRINTPWGMQEYNMHLLPTNVIDFDKEEQVAKEQKTTTIYIRRK